VGICHPAKVRLRNGLRERASNLSGMTNPYALSAAAGRTTQSRGPPRRVPVLPVGEQCLLNYGPNGPSRELATSRPAKNPDISASRTPASHARRSVPLNAAEKIRANLGPVGVTIKMTMPEADPWSAHRAAGAKGSGASTTARRAISQVEPESARKRVSTRPLFPQSRQIASLNR
jgi:hypothetical protein